MQYSMVANQREQEDMTGSCETYNKHQSVSRFTMHKSEHERSFTMATPKDLDAAQSSVRRAAAQEHSRRGALCKTPQQ